MSDPATDGIHLTKDYYKDFLPTDLQWDVTSVSDDFTLYDLFRLVYQADLMIPDIFTTMGMLEFKAFWEQIQRGRDPEDIDDVEYLELHWHFGYETRTTKKTGKPTDQETSNCAILRDNNENHWDDPKIASLSNLMGFHGIGPGCPSKDLDLHECGNDCPTDTGYAIEFTPLNNLAHLPIRVSPKVEFFQPYVESDRDFKRTGFELTIHPTLWCFITSIFWELTFAGSNPDEVSDHGGLIMDRMEEAKKYMKKLDEEKKDSENPDVS